MVYECTYILMIVVYIISPLEKVNTLKSTFSLRNISDKKK